MTFADAYYFIALLNPRDAGHAAATRVTAQRSGVLITTEWVLTEVGNTLSAPKWRSRFCELLASMRDDETVSILPATSEFFAKGVSLYRQRPDKAWSLTDCLSFVAMHEHGLSEALTGDHHFEQAGFTVLLSST